MIILTINGIISGMILPDTELEKKLWSKGYTLVCGLDEAGRGPLAGPVSAGAVVIDSKTEVIPFVRDSKMMSIKQREEAYELIKSSVVAWGIGMVEAEEIDRVGISSAVSKAMLLALRQVESQLDSDVEYLIVDGKNVLDVSNYPIQKVTKGDVYHYSISCASVLAKVERDRVMYKYAKLYPEYGFESHVGYGTKKHMEAIERYGILEIHRRSFKPVAKYV
jgi:ribonuclease HII